MRAEATLRRHESREIICSKYGAARAPCQTSFAHFQYLTHDLRNRARTGYQSSCAARQSPLLSIGSMACRIVLLDVSLSALYTSCLSTDALRVRRVAVAVALPGHLLLVDRRRERVHAGAAKLHVHLVGVGRPPAVRVALALAVLGRREEGAVRAEDDLQRIMNGRLEKRGETSAYARACTRMLTSRQSFHNQRVSFSHAISSLMPFLGASAFAPREPPSPITMHSLRSAYTREAIVCCERTQLSKEKRLCACGLCRRRYGNAPLNLGSVRIGRGRAASVRLFGRNC